MLILAIESSCDDCAAAVLEDGRVRVALRYHQDRLHRRWGGVVPEVASREHARQIDPTVKAALTRAGVTLADLDLIAVTQGPGLIGSLLVGLRYAQGLAITADIPLLGVHHLRAHLFSALMETPEPEACFPALGLVVSGGHTALYSVQGFGNVATLGETLDDAAGEAMDKTAKLLGLGFPGGAALSALAQKGYPAAFPLPKPLEGRDDLMFSFSGLKTAAARFIQAGGENLDKAGLAAAFETRVVEHLTDRTRRALSSGTFCSLLVGGGVACNAPLRGSLEALAVEHGLRLMLTKPANCTDNAAMIGYLAWQLHRNSLGEGFPVEPRVNWRADL